MHWWRFAAGNWDTPIWAFCERTDRLFWSEPFNAWSCLAYVLVALVLVVRWTRDGSRDSCGLILIVLVAAAGVGAFVLHTVATRGAVLLDVTPVTLFAILAAFLVLRRLLNAPVLVALLVLAVMLIAAQYYVQSVPWRIMNGYARHAVAPFFTLMAALAVLVRARAVNDADTVRAGRHLLIASVILAFAILIGGHDRRFCDVLPMGTHAFWHVLSALAMYHLVRAVTMHPRAMEQAR